MGKKGKSRNKKGSTVNVKNGGTALDSTNASSSINISEEGKKKTATADMEGRFAAAETRPQFRTPKPSTTKVVLDDRFSSVLTDSRFQLQEKDKYGRKNKKSKQKRDEDAAKEELKSFYVVKGNDEDEDDEDDGRNNEKDGRDQPETSKGKSYRKVPGEEDGDSNPSDSEDDRVEDPESRIAYLRAFSRGELDVSSSSEDDFSSQSSDEDGAGEDDGDDHPVYGSTGVLDPSGQRGIDVEISYDPSPYLVVTNMDWQNIRAVDLFTILSSFAPPGAVKKVQVLQSDFGIERMAKDRLQGPSDIWVKKKNGKMDSTDRDDSSSGDESDSEDSGNQGSRNEFGLRIEEESIPDESDFDPEKLRAYEASKLKYFFAVVEFSKPEHADIVYREVDGMEFEHSSSAIDLRTLPPEEVENVVFNRPLRDEATSVPGNYEPPEFVVSALQQTNVQCTWDKGDAEREKKLTKYGNTGWQDLVEADDLKAYLASDASSDDDSEDEAGTAKGSRMRKLLGLDGDDDDDSSARKGQESARSDDSDSDDGEGMSKEIRFIPGQKDLEEKIRAKLEAKDEEPRDLTPWQKFQERRKQKRKERRQAARGTKSASDSPDAFNEDKRIGKSGKGTAEKKERDTFFASDDDNDDHDHDDNDNIDEACDFYAQTGQPATIDQGAKERKAKAELELLLAGDDDDEQTRDYDIRGIQRLEKTKGKKLKGSRKRKEAKVAADVSGTSFKINVQDDRFKAVLDGGDGRYGIDKTDPNYKDTPAMREILTEQTKRRKKKRKHSEPPEVVPDVDANETGKTSGANALSSLVKRLKARVESNTGQ